MARTMEDVVEEILSGVDDVTGNIPAVSGLELLEELVVQLNIRKGVLADRMVNEESHR